MAESTELMTVGNIFNRVYIIRGQQVIGILKSQIATSSWGGKRKFPDAVTEQGIYMLTTVQMYDVKEENNNGHRYTNLRHERKRKKYARESFGRAD